MKNKLLKGAHLSERKFREILELFCDDLTATQIAEISGVSRVTINNYFKLIRNLIACYCEKNALAVSDLPASKKENESRYNEDNAYYGFSVVQNKVQTQWLRFISEESLQYLHASKTKGLISKISLPDFEGYQAIADCSGWHLYWLGSHQNNSFTEASHLSEIQRFWQHTKGRLLKFRGMSRSTLYFHIKESEFRHNLRDEELFPALLNILNGKDNVARDFSRAYSLVS